MTASQMDLPAMKPNWSPEHQSEATSLRGRAKAIAITLLSVFAKLIGRRAPGAREQRVSRGSPEGLGMKTMVVELKPKGGGDPWKMWM
jgi:hypothetical protein